MRLQGIKFGNIDECTQNAKIKGLKIQSNKKDRNHDL